MDLNVTPAVICTTGNYCSVFGILLMHIFVSFLIILMLPFRLRVTGTILNETELLLTKYYKNQSCGYDIPWPTLILFSFVAMSYLSSIYYLHYNKNRVLFWLFSYVKVSSNVLINVVVILSVVAEKSYEMINQHLRDLASQKPEIGQRSQSLEELMVLHWFVTDYVEHISHCFGVELCIIMMEIYAQLIIRMFVTSYVLFLHGLFPLSLDHQLVGVFDLLSVTSNLSYLCYRCDRVVYKGSQSQLFLQDICIQNNLDKHSKEVIHLFMMRLNCRKIVVDGYGFFTINLAQLVKIIGVVLTYFVVLVQFQTDNNASEHEIKVNKTDANSCEWPCVQF
ncbi:uncharacterized protein [Bemisia tabaci]|nr:PREDICTED: uncharacterized protein LOC109031660 [Bemisia tabaci]